ncbi:MAG: DUF29 domain-containing protein [Caldilineaceae bacterium]
MTTATHETDFYAWTQQQANWLRTEALEKLDLPNLAEEIEDMGRSEQRELDNRVTILLRHLLKLSCLPNSNPARGWRSTIKEQRYRIDRLLTKNPSLRSLAPEMIKDVYPEASDLALDDLTQDNLADKTFPARCPWTVEQILDLHWLP